MSANDNTALPYIVILDWDGTVAGRVDYQSYRHSLEQYYKQNGVKLKSDNKTVPKAFTRESYLIRRGLVKFIEELKAHFNGNIYFFIYTASERVWANREIQWVEKAYNIKFQRPIFTRDDCINVMGSGYKKTIAKIYPRVLRSIGKTRLTKSQKAYILEKHFMIIDNNAVYTDMQQHLLLCPHYDFMVFENIIEDIPDAHLQHPSVSGYIDMLVTQGIVCPVFKSNDVNKMMAEKYKWFATKCRQISAENKKYVNDTFFKKLKKLIIQNNVLAFTPSIIKQLQASCWKSTTV